MLQQALADYLTFVIGYTVACATCGAIWLAWRRGLPGRVTRTEGPRGYVRIRTT